MKENAGYKIVKEEMYNEKYGIVLGINEKAYVKYVTWEFAISYNETEFFLGHYFENEKEALEDYHKRLAYYYKVLPF